MTVLTDLAGTACGETSVALGYFDGVHIAHQYLIKEMEKCAEKEGLQKAIFTFTKSIKLGHKGKDIYNREQKKEVMETFILGLGENKNPCTLFPSSVAISNFPFRFFPFGTTPSIFSGQIFSCGKLYSIFPFSNSCNFFFNVCSSSS